MKRWLALTILVAIAGGGCGHGQEIVAQVPYSDQIRPELTQREVMEQMPVTRPASDFTWSHDAIIRGPRDEKVMSLIFTGGSWGQGSMFILDALEERGIRGSFYFTGEFIDNPDHREAIERMVRNGHTVGAHGHGHLLYAPWEDRSQTLVTKEEFTEDLEKNIEQLLELGLTREQIVWWIPPYEWYNEQIVEWSLEMGMRLFNYTPGTISHADYTEGDAPNYRSTELIFNNVIEYEERTGDNMNGFMLLTHVGASPKRPDMFYYRLPELIDILLERGYSFVRVEELLEGAPLMPE